MSLTNTDNYIHIANVAKLLINLSFVRQVTYSVIVRCLIKHRGKSPFCLWVRSSEGYSKK